METCTPREARPILDRVERNQALAPANWLVDRLRLNYATDTRVLLYDPADNTYAVWMSDFRQMTGRGVHRLVVHWDGEVIVEDANQSNTPWTSSVADRVQAYLISRAQVETLVMLARHMYDKTAWANAAMRWGRNHGGRMVRCTSA